MTQYISDLEGLVQEWGRQFSQHYGTKCMWIDLHAKNPLMKDYQKYKIAAKVDNVHYDGTGTAIDLPGKVVTDTTTNDTSLQQKSTFKHTLTTTSTFTWTMKESIKVGIELEFAVGVAPIASATTKMSVDVSVESTQSQTKTETQTWEIDREVLVPPHTQTKMTWTISEKGSSAVFYADIILTGYVAIWNDEKIDVNNPGGDDKHWLWFIPIDRVFMEMKEYGIDVPSQYDVDIFGSVTYHASGECKGSSGYSTTFNLQETPLPNDRKGISLPSPRIITAYAVPAIEQ